MIESTMHDHGHDRSALADGVRAAIAAGLSELDEGSARELLGDVVPFGPAIACETPDDVVVAADRIGYPVVLKGLSPGLLHKSEHRLVRVGLMSADLVASAARELAQRLSAAAPGAPQTLSVQAQLAGVEMAIGIQTDALGKVCMVSAGGTLIELLDDSRFSMAPVDLARARTMVEQLRIAPQLAGYRDAEAVDVDALVELLVNVSRVAASVPEIAELDLNPVFVSATGVAVADARCVLRAAPEAAPPRLAGDAVRLVFEPRRIAVVGASADTSKPGGLLLRYLRKHVWDGELLAINPRAGSIDGLRTYASLDDVEGPVDLACIAVPATAVASVVEQCVERGVAAGIIFSAGYAETGHEGLQAQRRLLEISAGRFRFVGPNTIGVASPVDHLFATFGMGMEGELPPQGRIGLVSQSGAIASSLISRARELGIGFSHWVSTGNEADLGLADYIDYLVDDEQTSAICAFVEAIRDPAAFALACTRARAAGKPVIALKAGRSEAGRAAAASHTGALAGRHRVYQAFTERCGVLEAQDLPGLFAAAHGLLQAGPVDGRRVGIISMSGGACSLLADACAELGLEVPALSTATQAALSDLLPAFGSVRNPVDVTAQGIGTPDLVGRAVELVRQSGEVDIVLVQMSTNADPGASRIAADLIAARRRAGVPFLVGRLGARELAPAAVDLYIEHGVHVFSWPEQMVRAAAACAQYRSVLDAAPTRDAQVG